MIWLYLIIIGEIFKYKIKDSEFKIYRYNLIACQALEKVLTCFGKIIYDNVGAKSIGVDLSQQAR